MACTQTVKVTYDKKKNPARYELLCAGTCADGNACKKKTTTDASGSTREYCRCTNGEDDTCHIVLYTVRKKPGGKVEDTYFQCEWDPNAACPAATPKCVPVPVRSGTFADDPDSIEWMEFECQCVKEAQAGPKHPRYL